MQNTRKKKGKGGGTNVDLQRAGHAPQQHVHDANVGRTAVKEGYAVEQQGESQPEFSIVPYRGAAIPETGSQQLPWKRLEREMLFDGDV